MSSRGVNIWKSIDWFVVVIYALMALCGWVSIYAASYNYDHVSIFDFASRSGKQLMWIGMASIIFFFIMLIEYRSYETLAPIIYVIMLLVLVVTIFIAPDVKGSRSHKLRPR